MRAAAAYNKPSNRLEPPPISSLGLPQSFFPARFPTFHRQIRAVLIGNDMHSPASATALQCATSIFLIGNEFRLQDANFRRIFARRLKRRRAAALQKRKAPRSQIEHGAPRRARFSCANEDRCLRGSGLKPRQKSVADSSSYRALHPFTQTQEGREGFRPCRLDAIFAIRFSSFGFRFCVGE